MFFQERLFLLISSTEFYRLVHKAEFGNESLSKETWLIGELSLNAVSILFYEMRYKLCTRIHTELVHYIYHLCSFEPILDFIQVLLFNQTVQ